MATFLNIESAVESASIALTREGGVISESVNHRQQDHAAWLHSAIREMVKDQGISLRDIDAIAVSIGPGSYTGLRIGLSAAKGLCFATGIPLISVGTLEIIAAASNKTKADLFCPMIDARRLEVFTAVYDKDLNERVQPKAMILNQDSFQEYLMSATVCFCGNGQKKLQSMIAHPNAIFDNTEATAANMAAFTYRSFLEKRFSDLVYTEPLYVKEFYTPISMDIK